jgi:dipeptidyl aminopeptidase/acylaminoacyl peptidase
MMRRLIVPIAFPLIVLSVLVLSGAQLLGVLLPDGGILRYLITDAHEPGFLPYEADLLRGLSLPVPFTERISDGAWSPDGRYLSRIVDESNTTSTEVFDLRNGQVALTIYSFSAFPRWSPNSDQLIYAHLVSPVRVSMPSAQELVPMMRPDPFPAGWGDFVWSPDQQRIAVWGTFAQGVQLYIVEVNEGLPRPVHAQLAYSNTPRLQWSADSRWIYYAANFGTGYDLARTNVTTSETQVIAGGFVEIGTLSLSPDNRHMAFVVVPEVDDAAPRRPINPFVYVVDLATGVLRNLTADLRMTVTLGNTLAVAGWTPDSQRVIVHIYRNGLVETRLIEVASGVSSTFEGYQFRWSPDQRQAAYLYPPSGNYTTAQLCLITLNEINASQSVRRCLTPGGHQIGDFVWMR